MKAKIISPLLNKNAFEVIAMAVIDSGKFKGHPYEITMAIFDNLDPAIAYCKGELASLPDDFCFHIKAGIVNDTYLGITIVDMDKSGNTNISLQYLDLL